MEARISKIEQDMALMSQATQNISKTLDKMSEMYTDGKVLDAKVESMDKELVASFNRINKRIDIESESRRWITRVTLLGLSGIVMDFIYRHLS